MKARVGDRLIRDGGDGHRVCEIIALHHADGSPPYVVRWLSDGHIALLYPGPYMRLAHQRAGRSAEGKEPATGAPAASRESRGEAGGAETGSAVTGSAATGGTPKGGAVKSSAVKSSAVKSSAVKDSAVKDSAAKDSAAKDTGKGTAARPGAHRRVNPFLPRPLAAPWPSQGST